MSMTPERGVTISLHILNIKSNLDEITLEELSELIRSKDRVDKLDLLIDPATHPTEGRYEAGRRLLWTLYHLKKLKEEI